VTYELVLLRGPGHHGEGLGLKAARRGGVSATLNEGNRRLALVVLEMRILWVGGGWSKGPVRLGIRVKVKG
jgi:hypothetical protein